MGLNQKATLCARRSSSEEEKTVNIAFIKGLGLGLSLIVAIGAQNAFVLSQSLRKNHVLTMVLASIAFDAIGISLGVAGVGALVAGNTALMSLTSWGGALFLLWYGFNSFRSALSGGTLETSSDDAKPSRKKIFLALMAVTFLNPHYYLDTVVLIGSLASQFPGMDRLLFWAGTLTASVIWFFSLGFGAGLLVPLFRKPVTWKILDGLIGCTMWSIAFGLIRSALA